MISWVGYVGLILKDVWKTVLFLATVPEGLDKTMYFVFFEWMNQAYCQQTYIFIKIQTHCWEFWIINAYHGSQLILKQTTLI